MRKSGQVDLFGQTSAYDDPNLAADAALRAVRSVARRFPEFTTDEVAAELTDWQIEEPRLLGPAMLRAQRAGWIAATDRMRKTANPAAHCRPKAVWKSCIYEGAHA
jgi:hypothetical protein